MCGGCPQHIYSEGYIQYRILGNQFLVIVLGLSVQSVGISIFHIVESWLTSLLSSES